jgi:hypothetical protein
MLDSTLSEKQEHFEDDEKVSAVVPVATSSMPPILVDLAQVMEPLDVEVLGRSLESRLDEMLRRLNDRDYLATLVLAESILLAKADHGLAVICRNEALSGLESVMGGALVREADGKELNPDTQSLLDHVDGKQSVHALLPGGIKRVRTLRALHDLFRLGLVRTAPTSK